MAAREAAALKEAGLTEVIAPPPSAAGTTHDAPSLFGWFTSLTSFFDSSEKDIRRARLKREAREIAKVQQQTDPDADVQCCCFYLCGCCGSGPVPNAHVEQAHV